MRPGGTLPRVAVLASGRGSNFLALAEAVQRGELPIEICGVVSDREGAPVLGHARGFGIPALFLGAAGRTPEARLAHEQKIVEQLRRWRVRWVICAGYMRILGPHLLEAFRDARGFNRIVNIHPALLPAFPGLGAYAQAFRHGVAVAGASVHLVAAEVDDGPILSQAGFAIHDCESVAEVEARGLEVEHRLYPETLKWLCAEKFRVERLPGGRLRVRSS